MSLQSATERRRRSDGERSRRAILDVAARLATVEGIDGLSIGGLAKASGMSKSGIYAHFGSKEELQLETIDAAEQLFNTDVIEPAMQTDDGLPRVEALCEGFLSHVERGVFPGGCFFSSVAAELDTRPGPVRDRIAVFLSEWIGLIAASLGAAQREGDVDEDASIEQLAFELNAMLAQANAVFLLYGDRKAFDLARRAIRDRLERAANLQRRKR
jgi:AcrR family transcriptional regulator